MWFGTQPWILIEWGNWQVIQQSSTSWIRKFLLCILDELEKMEDGKVWNRYSFKITGFALNTGHNAARFDKNYIMVWQKWLHIPSTFPKKRGVLAEREREIILAARRDICAEVSPRINQHYKYDRCLSTCYKHLAHALGCFIMVWLFTGLWSCLLL